MTKKTRYFVLASAAILAVGLTTGLVASYMGLPLQVFTQAAGPDELQYVPADAAVVAYANVRDVMNSQFRQRFRELEPESRERDEFQRQTGLDIEHDIDTVVAAMMPGDDRGPKGGMLVLARGRFQQAQLERLALDKGGQVEDYQGVRLLRTAEDRDDDHMAMGFLEADVVALGSYEAVRHAIDAGRASRNIRDNNELMSQVAELDGNSAWAVGRFDAIAREARLPNEVQAQLPALTWFTAAGHVNGGVSGVVRAEARDEQAAQNVRDMLRGFLALARMQSGNNPGLKAMVDTVQLTGDGRSVSLSFTIPTEVFEALEALGRQRQGAGQER
ncbi:MAG: hypothetical protein AB7O67_00860 [Vicinamibacterales bacterium]